MPRRLLGQVTIPKEMLLKALSDLAAKIAASGSEQIDARLCKDGLDAELVLFEAGIKNRIAKLHLGRIK